MEELTLDDIIDSDEKDNIFIEEESRIDSCDVDFSNKNDSTVTVEIEDSDLLLFI